MKAKFPVFMTFLVFSVSGCMLESFMPETTTSTTATSTTVPPARTVVKVDTGMAQTLLLMSDGTVWAAGNNDGAQFASSDFGSTNRFVQIFSNAKDAAVGYGSFFALDNSGDLWGCGLNQYGQLGYGDLFYTNRFILIDRNVEKVFADPIHPLTYIIKSDGSLGLCGANNVGQLGTGSWTYSIPYVYYHPALRDIVYATGGMGFTILVRSDGSVWGSGLNDYGQLGYATNTYSTNVFLQTFSGAVAAGCGEQFTMLLRSDGSVWAAGHSGNGQFGNGMAGGLATVDHFVKAADNVKQLECGWEYTLILKNDNTVWGAGLNIMGPLGNIGSFYTNYFAFIMSNVAQISAANVHSVILKTDGTVWASGYNGYGQFGIGTNFNSTNKFIRIY